MNFSSSDIYEDYHDGENFVDARKNLLCCRHHSDVVDRQNQMEIEDQENKSKIHDLEIRVHYLEQALDNPTRKEQKKAALTDGQSN